MLFPTSNYMFLLLLLTGSIISISSTSWFSAWIGLELNMLCFIPLITSKMNFYLSEAAVKYFLIQAMGSAMLISSSFFLIYFTFLSHILILASLLLKLASAPFHLWLPQIIEGLTWFQVFLLSTLQKLAPMILMSYLYLNPFMMYMIIFCAVCSAVLGALGGLNVMYLRKIIAFSSINHLSWLLIAILTSEIIWLLYFLIYFIILSTIISMFSKLNIFTFSSLIQYYHNNSYLYFLIIINLLSLGGLPPLIGFIPKWLLIQLMINYYLIIPLIFMLFSSLITLYFYMRISNTLSIMYTPILSFNTKYNYTTFSFYMSIFIMSFNLLGILLPTFMLFT
uniref:NADH dehydrogenase subunit 2 n=1 Tax=Kroppcarcinus siderastreicola TaxID=1903112 RepID=UPI0028D85CFC|nr:NADH dehydrogenase subunit 2 [Kroppcarcinus siderastreicola]WMY25239.1 NADH dehydrogenase subunit 2 [Kroppcarcinus siderastreicola]